MLARTILILCLLNSIYSTPIQQVKLCNLDNFTNDFNYELLEGEWFDLVRTKLIYNENTWKNGYASIMVDKSLKKIELNFSGIDNLGKCEYSSKIEMYYSNNTDLKSQDVGLRVLSYSENIVVVAMCLNGSQLDDFCDTTKLDLFVWSRSRFLNNISEPDYYKSYLETYCINSNDIVYSDSNLNVCFQKEETESLESFVAIAEITSEQNLTNLVNLNKTNSIEINIELTTNKTDLNSTLFVKLIKSLKEIKVNNVSLVNTTSTTFSTKLSTTTSKSLENNQNLTFDPILVNEDKNETLIQDENVDNDLMIIGLRRNNSNNTNFEPLFVEIELGSGESELKENLTDLITTVQSEIVLKKFTNSNNLETSLKNDLDADKEEVLNTDEELNENETTKENRIETTEDYDKEINKLETIVAETTTIKEDSNDEDNVASIDLEITTKYTNLNEVTNYDQEITEIEETDVKETTFTPVIENNSEELSQDGVKEEDDLETSTSSSSTTIESTEQTSTINTETNEEITTSTSSNECPDIQCPVTVCNYGHKKDENGCNTCDCLKNSNSTEECSPPYCHPCFYGSFTDVNGCESCACKPRPKPKSVYECPKLDCPSCNYGSIKDEYGCETCICIRPNSVEPTYQCSAIPTCPYGACKHGSVLNDFGCPTCDCLKSVEPDRQECVKEKCQPCQYGYFTDVEGCETCMCKPEWMAPCGQVEVTCDSSKCKHGTYLDRNGCPSCECLPDPSISTMTCFEMQDTNGQTECNNDGTFKSKQCNDQECRCVTKDGIPVSDFKAPINESQYMNCECALALYDVSAFKAVGFKLYCAPNGNYETIQCVGSSCACVNEHGDPLGPSVPIYQKHLLRCEGVFQRVYYDQYLTTIAPTTLTPPLCIYHRERAQEMSNIDAHMSIPICDEKGLYEPLQCDRQKKYCWCVNIHNGVELNGSRRTGQIPDCNS